jgi:hypothetical protein
MSNRPLAVLTLLCGSLMLPFTASSQVLYGSLTGNVTDTSGAPVPNAKVDAANIATGIAKQAITDERGVFLVQDVQAGVYKLTFSAPSFANTVETGVEVVENTPQRWSEHQCRSSQWRESRTAFLSELREFVEHYGHASHRCIQVQRLAGESHPSNG